jgi:cysteine desulfurase/selenocysteine lyase
VIETLVDFYERHNANIHRGVYTLALEATEAYEAARAALARFVGASDPDCIVFNRGTTESVNLVAHSWARPRLREGDEIVLTEMEHHSNIVPWQLAAQATGARLRYVPITDEGLLDLEAYESILSDRTRLVAVTGMSNVLGSVPPLRRIADAAHAEGAIVVVDGAQLVPHAPVNVNELDIDVLTISGHKMLGPTASGGLYAKRELLEEMEPFMAGGEMIERVGWESSTWKAVPWKFEGGTMNIAQEVGLGSAVDYLDRLGMSAVRRHEEQLTRYAIDRLSEAGARVFGPHDETLRGSAVSFWFRDIHPHDLAEVLNTQGVCIRAGHHCAQPLMRRLEVPATSRASFNVYNTPEEVDALVDGLHIAEKIFG